MEDLQQRIEKLTPDQYQRLAEHLQSARPARLHAYVAVSSQGDDIGEAALKQFLGERLPDHLIPSSVSILPGLPHLPNGKIDRSALKEIPDSPSSAATLVDPKGQTESALLKIWRDILGFEEISIYDDFFEIGGDSLLSIQLVSRARSNGIEFQPADLIDHPTISELASVSDTKAQTIDVDSHDKISADSFPLTPIQSWFFDLKLAKAEQWNQALSFQLDPGIDQAALSKIVDSLILLHDQLRVGLKNDGGTWVHQLCEPRQLDFLDSSDPEIASLQESFRFDGSPLVRFAEIRSDKHLELIVVAHHLIIDHVSWQILTQDLAQAARTVLQGQQLQPASRSASFSEWALRLEQLGPDEFRDEITFWKAIEVTRLGRLPMDYENVAEVTEAHRKVVQLDLGPVHTEALSQSAIKTYHTNVEDILLTALAISMEKWTGEKCFRIGLERHGRNLFEDSLDVSSSVGWFTSYFPARIKLNSNGNPDSIIKSIKEQLRLIPRSGVGYGVLRYSGDHDVQQQVGSDEVAEEVLFNYLGRKSVHQCSDSNPIQSIKDLKTGTRAPENRRPHLLEINCWMEESSLKFDWVYCLGVHNESTLIEWTRDYMSALTTLIDHCTSANSPKFTPSDFPEAEMSQEDLDDFLHDL